MFPSAERREQKVSALRRVNPPKTRKAWCRAVISPAPEPAPVPAKNQAVTREAHATPKLMDICCAVLAMVVAS